MENGGKLKKDKKDKKEKTEKKDKKDKKDKKEKKEQVQDGGDSRKRKAEDAASLEASPEASPDVEELPRPSPSPVLETDDLLDAIFTGDGDDAPATGGGGGAEATADGDGAGDDADYGMEVDETGAYQDEGGVEAAFWDALGAEEDDDEQQQAEADAREKQRIASFNEGGGAVLTVPPEAVGLMSRKIERIASMSGASIGFRNGLLKITGTTAEARERAELYARGVLGEKLDEAEAAIDGMPIDLTMVPMPADREEEGQSWYESLIASIEYEEQHVLLFQEQPRPERAKKLRVSQVVEAERPGSDGGARQAASIIAKAGGKLRVRWTQDNVEEEIPMIRASPALRIGIFGEDRARLRAEMRLMTAANEKVPGIIFAQLRARDGGTAANRPGGQAIEVLKLEVMREVTMTALQRKQHLWAIQQATGLGGLSYFVDKTEYQADRDRKGKGKGKGKDKDKGDKGKDKNKGRIRIEGRLYALLAGDRESRWLAGQVVQQFSLGVDFRKLDRLPRHLAAEYSTLRIPKDLLGKILGAGQSNRDKMMQDTGTFMFLLSDSQGDADAKGQAEDLEDFMEAMMDSHRRGQSSTMAIFGPARGRSAAEIKIHASIEDKLRGYYKEPSSGEELSDSIGLAVDKIWLEAQSTTGESSEFEVDASRTNAELVAAASGCAVESAGRLVFLAGVADERQKAREYTYWFTSKRIFGVHPQIADLESRSDAVSLTVPLEAFKKKAFKQEILNLQKRTGTLIFPCESEDTDDLRRMVIAGTEVATKGAEFAERMLNDCKTISDHVLSGAEGPSGWWSQTNGGWWSNSSGWWSQDGGDWWSKDGWNQSGASWQGKDSVPPPATPALPGRGVAPPATPALPGRGVAPPATPALPGGVALPATPAFPGGGVAPPATPGLPGGVRPPATPAFGAPPPATPGLPGGNVPPPATPAVPRFGVPPPATPAPQFGTAGPATPGNFGPHGSAVPATPGVFGAGGMASPATPGIGVHGVLPPATPAGGFGPHGAAVPATPGIPGRPPPATPGLPGAPPPQTPAWPQAAAGGSSSSTARIPAPQTPAGLGGAAAPKRNVPAPATPAGLASIAATRDGAMPSAAGPGGPAQRAVAAPATPAGLAGASAAAGTAVNGAATIAAAVKLISSTLEDIAVSIPVDDGKGGERMESRRFQRCLSWKTLHPPKAETKPAAQIPPKEAEATEGGGGGKAGAGKTGAGKAGAGKNGFPPAKAKGASKGK